MKFEKLHKDLPDNINCIKSEYKEDTKTTFARKIHNDPIEALSEVNFMSYWENGKRPPTKENNICNYKGVSLFVNGMNLHEITSKIYFIMLNNLRENINLKRNIVY